MPTTVPDKCPWCGADPEVVYLNDNYLWCVSCSNMEHGNYTCVRYLPTRDAAIQAWNEFVSALVDGKPVKKVSLLERLIATLRK